MIWLQAAIKKKNKTKVRKQNLTFVFQKYAGNKPVTEFMNSKMIMTSSAAVLAAAAFIFTFMPVEFLRYANLESTKTAELFVQVLGALYFGFAMLNWMTRTSIIGGIYNKPIAVANFSHFFIAGVALVKGVLFNPELPYAIWIIAAIYALFTICFGIIFSRNPVSKKEPA